jgi:K+-transporting ATPase A subunit
MSINQSMAADTAKNRRTAPLTVVLAVVFVVFCGILVFAFIATKRANPVMLDLQGKPLEQSSQGKH